MARQLGIKSIDEYPQHNVGNWERQYSPCTQPVLHAVAAAVLETDENLCAYTDRSIWPYFTEKCLHF